MDFPLSPDASAAKQASALAKLGATTLPLDESSLMRMLVIALGNVTAGGGGGGSGTVTSVAQTFTGGIISVTGSPITTSGTLALTVAGTSGGIPYFDSNTTWATSARLALNSLLIGGGAGGAPSSTVTGTGVVTALGVNVGTAGAFVVNGGALGTPSSGTLTNCTGLPPAGVVGTAAILGANTFTALQTITQASANAGIIASTGYSLTGSNATSMVSYAGTLNTSGVPSVFKMATTVTATGTSTKLMEILGSSTGAQNVLSVFGAATQTGTAYLQVGSFFLGDYAGISSMWFGTTNNPFASQAAFSNEGVVVNKNTAFLFGSDTFANSSADLYMRRAAAASLQLGSDAAASQVSQLFTACGPRVGTDSNTTPTNTLTIAGPRCTGTGTGGDLRLSVYGTNGVSGTAIGTLNTILTIVAARKVVNISSIPTSSAGLSAGDVYSNAGILTIV